jgi:hypothetical protein
VFTTVHFSVVAQGVTAFSLSDLFVKKLNQMNDIYDGIARKIN